MLSEIGPPYDWPVGLFFLFTCRVFKFEFERTHVEHNLKEHMSKTIQCSYWINISVFSHVAALPTLKAKWLDTITVKRWEILINNDVSLSSATNEETPYEQLHYYPASRGPSIFLFPTYLGRSKGLCSQGTTLPIFNEILTFTFQLFQLTTMRFMYVLNLTSVWRYHIFFQL